jgi:preprotein translocase subunit SecE
MENENKKIITLSFLVLGTLVAFTLGLLLDAFSATFGFVARAVSNDVFRHGLPVVSGILTFSLLQFNSKVLAYSDEVITEVKKVVWPSRKDTTAMTIVVVVMLLISGVILGLFDFVSGYLINFIVK